MPAVDFTESIVELAALEWFGEHGYTIGHGSNLEPGGVIEVRVIWRMRRRSLRMRQRRPTTTNHNQRQTAILEVIPPVASTAGEGRQPPGGGHLRVALFAFPPPEPLR